MRILIATDAWAPQINGVVVALVNTIACLRRIGHDVTVISPEGFRTIPTPTYPEIPLALFPGRKVARLIDEARPDAIHIATEGPIGSAARTYCLRNGLRFTTQYHTCFPEYIQMRTGIPVDWMYPFMRRFHDPAAAVIVATEPLGAMLAKRGFAHIEECPLGVDLELFKPSDEHFTDLPRPVFTYVGRLAVEKDLPAFLGLQLPGSKLVVGDGPARAKLQRRFPNVRFVGAKTGPELASYYQRSDVFVFPSRTETFGLVMLEAMACGVPVAAFPVRGPLDVVKDPGAGVLLEDLREAALRALDLERGAGRAYAERFPWSKGAERFLSILVPVSANLKKTEMESSYRRKAVAIGPPAKERS